jgi:hypothetical protein
VFVRETLELFGLLGGTLIEGERRIQANDAIARVLNDGLTRTGEDAGNQSEAIVEAGPPKKQ